MIVTICWTTVQQEGQFKDELYYEHKQEWDVIGNRVSYLKKTSSWSTSLHVDVILVFIQEASCEMIQNLI